MSRVRRAVVFGFVTVLVAGGLVALSPAAAQAATAPSLGAAGNFAVLAGSMVTNTGTSVINGDLGVSPGSSVTGFPPGILNGTTHANDAVAQQAQNDLTTAYNNAAGQPCGTTFSNGQELGGLTLTPGVYCFSGGVGPVDRGTTHARRSGGPQRGLHLPDRQHPDHHRTRRCYHGQ